MIIDIIGLTKTYKRIKVVNNLNFMVETGEVFGFLGPNGAGKTTTVRMLTTVIPPDQGTAKVNGFDIRRDVMRVRKSFAVLPQGGGLNVVLSVEENIWLYLVLLGWSPAKARSRAQSIMSQMGLLPHKHKISSELSGGLRRRVQVARVLASDTPLLFLDEPTVGLDPQSRQQTWQAIKEAQSNGTSIFLTTQVMEEAEALCDRVAFIKDGTVIAIDTVDRLRRQYSKPRFRIEVSGLSLHAMAHIKAIQPDLHIECPSANGDGGPPPDVMVIWSAEPDIPDTIAQIYRHQGQVKSLAQEIPRLEDIYLQLMTKEQDHA